VLPTKNLYLSASRTHPLNYPVNFIRLPTRLADLTDDHVCVDASVDPRWPLEITRFIQDGLNPYEHVFFCMAGDWVLVRIAPKRPT